MPKPSKKFIGAIASFVFSASIYFGQRWAEMSGIISPSSTPILTIVTACIGGGLLLWNYWPDIVKHKLASTTNIDKTISVADYTLDILHEMKYKLRNARGKIKIENIDASNVIVLQRLYTTYGTNLIQD